jgi:hypothetical protein
MKSDLPKGFPDQGFLQAVAKRPLPFVYAWPWEDGMTAGYRQGATGCYGVACGAIRILSGVARSELDNRHVTAAAAAAVSAPSLQHNKHQAP